MARDLLQRIWAWQRTVAKVIIEHRRREYNQLRISPARRSGGDCGFLRRRRRACRQAGIRLWRRICLSRGRVTERCLFLPTGSNECIRSPSEVCRDQEDAIGKIDTTTEFPMFRAESMFQASAVIIPALNPSTDACPGIPWPP